MSKRGEWINHDKKTSHRLIIKWPPVIFILTVDLIFTSHSDNVVLKGCSEDVRVPFICGRDAAIDGSAVCSLDGSWSWVLHIQIMSVPQQRKSWLLLSYSYKCRHQMRRYINIDLRRKKNITSLSWALDSAKCYLIVLKVAFKISCKDQLKLVQKKLHDFECLRIAV